uniref:TTF-type domain-containing protein n=1 Tax=Fundulus heteroclitus TaxID=8078 RepID=A0A3Q2QG90_FUNHE
MDDSEKFQLVKTRIPPTSFNFPAREFKDNRRAGGVTKRTCQRDWLDKYDFLSYSAQEDGVYCLPCILFPVQSQNRRAGMLIDLPFTNWRKFNEQMTTHMQQQYHRSSDAKLHAFVDLMNGQQTRINHTLSTEMDKRVQDNRLFLSSVIKCHRDDPSSETLNKDNFLALLKFRQEAGDGPLKNDLDSCSQNAKYISETSQNDLLDCIKEYIQSTIVHDVLNQEWGPYYAVIADEVADVSNYEQLGVRIRYVKDGIPVERLIDFVGCDSITGEAVCTNLLTSLRKVGLDPKLCRAQGYDGAGRVDGCAANFCKESPRAKYFHCASHQLNLINQERLAAEQELLAKKKIKLMCETRWVDRHTSLEDFHNLYEALLHCLNVISENADSVWDAKAIVEANELLRAVTSANFIAALQCNRYFSGFTKSLSTLLQGSSQDVLTAYEEVKLVKDTLRDIRCEAEAEFKEVYESMVEMGKLAGFDDDLPIPRRCGRQTTRNNNPSDNPMEYWRCTVFVPFLDSLISEFDSRFSVMSSAAILGLKLLPSNLHMMSDESEKEIFRSYKDDLPSGSTFRQEVKLWHTKWSSSVEKPSSLPEILRITNMKCYPNISMILHLLSVMPVTSASEKRANSGLKAVKTLLGSTMGQERFVALVLMYVHKDIHLDINKIIDIFAQKHPRRLTFVNPLS